MACWPGQPSRLPTSMPVHGAARWAQIRAPSLTPTRAHVLSVHHTCPAPSPPGAWDRCVNDVNQPDWSDFVGPWADLHKGRARLNQVGLHPELALQSLVGCACMLAGGASLARGGLSSTGTGHALMAAPLLYAQGLGSPLCYCSSAPA